jgi:SAM-dependent methyltransferase
MGVTTRLVETQRAFDAVAADYAASTSSSVVLESMRRHIRAALRRYAPVGSRVLDLGCGPGLDAACLARAGYHVTALDWSPEMVRAADARFGKTDGRTGSATAVNLGIQELERLSPRRWDGAYSGLGALNCVPDLAAAARGLAARLRPGGVLVASVMGRVCPWELVVAGIRMDWRRAGARFASGAVGVPFHGNRVWTWYYTPRAFEHAFTAAGFTRVALRGLAVLAPPPYLDRFARRHPRLIERLLRIDDRVAHWPGLRHCGDHFLMVLRHDG